VSALIDVREVKILRRIVTVFQWKSSSLTVMFSLFITIFFNKNRVNVGQNSLPRLSILLLWEFQDVVR
jgi:hypothetical protein